MLLQIFVVFQDVAVWCIVVQCDAAVLQYVAVRCSRAFLHILVQLLIYVGDVCVCVCVCVFVWQTDARNLCMWQGACRWREREDLQAFRGKCVAVCCSVLKCVAVR